MRIAVIGADGQLGSDLIRFLGEDRLDPLCFPDFDIAQPDKARNELFRLSPDLVINTAAYHRVDECEGNPAESFRVNAIAVRDLAVTCRDLGCSLVHFSTDYVFDGAKKEPYTETDCPNPLSVYATSKLAGEILVRNVLEKHFLIRTCGLYGEAGCKEKGMNFVERIISLEREGRSLRIVDDQWVTPTSTAELAGAVSALIRTSRYGLYHMTNEGQCSWFEFARTVFNLIGKSPTIVPVDSVTYGAPAKRPRYSVLENKKAKEIGLPEFSHWSVALEEYLVRRGHRPADWSGAAKT